MPRAAAVMPRCGKEIGSTMVHHADEHDMHHQAVRNIMDMVVAEIDNVPALRSGMELVSGIIVRSVRWGGAADQAGVAAGDVISEVNGIPVRTLEDLELILEARTGSEPFRFLFRRVDAWRYLALPCDVLRPAAGSCRVRAQLPGSPVPD